MRITPKKLRCAGCGEPIYKGSGSLPQGQAKCQPCRRQDPAVTHPCPDCGVRCQGIYCRPCSGRRRRIRPDGDRRTTRASRERSAPGLPKRDREALFAKWRRQGRSCAYCDRSADTMEHVIPLVRGGTNFEGNLVPACRSCNSSKRHEFVIEWRTRRARAA